MKTCATCKHWRDSDYDPFRIAGKKECRKIRDDDGYPVPRRGTDLDRAVISTEDWHGRNVLMTCADFGCTLWETE